MQPRLAVAPVGIGFAVGLVARMKSGGLPPPWPSDRASDAPHIRYHRPVLAPGVRPCTECRSYDLPAPRSLRMGPGEALCRPTLARTKRPADRLTRLPGFVRNPNAWLSPGRHRSLPETLAQRNSEASAVRRHARAAPSLDREAHKQSQGSPATPPRTRRPPQGIYIQYLTNEPVRCTSTTYSERSPP